MSANLRSPDEAVDRHPATVGSSTSLAEAIALMRRTSNPCPLPNSPAFSDSNETVKASISCVLVVDENQLVGLLSPEDVLNLAAAKYGWQGMKVADAMTRNLIVLKESEFTDLITAFKLFCQYSIDCLPIVDERGQPVGIVSEKRIRPAMYSWIEARHQEMAKLQEQWQLLEGNCEREKVSDRQNAESAMQQSEARYLAIVEDQTELICRYLPDGKITFVNQAYCRYFGVQPLDLLGKCFLSLLPEADREIFQQQYTSVSPDNPIFTCEHRVILPSGEIRWQQWIDRAIFDESGQIVEYQAAGRDVTDRKQAEIALQQLNAELELRVQQRTQWYEMAVSAGKVGVWDWNLETGEIYIAPSLKALLGYQDAEIPNRMENWVSHVHPDDRVAVEEAVKAYLEGVTDIYEVEHRMLRKDGSTCWILARGSAIRSACGKALHLTGTDTDITERKLTEEKLQNSEAELLALFNAMTDIVLVFDASGRYLKIAPTAPELLYKPAPEVVGKTLAEVFPEAEANFALAHIRQTLASGQTHRVEYRMEIGCKLFWFDASISPLEFDRVMWGRPRHYRSQTRRSCTAKERGKVSQLI